MRSLTRLAPVPLVAAALLVAAPAATAKAPPTGVYRCEIRSVSGILPSGSFELTSKRRYVVSKKPGAYRVRGKRVIFRSGLYKRYRWHGVYRPASSEATHTIIVSIDPEDADAKMYCYRDNDEGRGR